jgi:hypothetical protein
MLELVAQLQTSVSEESWSVFSGSTMFIALLVVVAVVAALWKIFEKAGEDGWKALVPVYNSWILFEISGKPGWWALVGLVGIIPILGLFAGLAAYVLYILAMLELGKAFGKSTAFTVVALVIFSFIGLLILGFGNDKYTKPSNNAPKAVAA